MPNARKKGKVMIGGYMPEELGDAMDEKAKQLGLTKKDLLEQIIRKYLGKEEETK